MREAVHDGDTVTVEADGAFSVRFLGVDTPEVSFEFPKLPGDPRAGTFRSITEFQEYLSDPFKATYPDSQKYARQLENKLVNYLKPKLIANTASNHHKYAIAAQRELESIIEFDVNERAYEGENLGSSWLLHMKSWIDMADSSAMQTEITNQQNERED